MGRKVLSAQMKDDRFSKRQTEVVHVEKEFERQMTVKTSRVKLSCPKHLSEGAKAEWRRVMALYRKMDLDILSDLDQTALSMYCTQTDIFLQAQAQWADWATSNERNVVGVDEEEQHQIARCISVINESSKRVAALAEQLCLTPIGRARMAIQLAKKKDSSQANELGDLFGFQEGSAPKLSKSKLKS